LEKLTQPHGISISIAFSGPSALRMFNSGTKNEITRFQNRPTCNRRPKSMLYKFIGYLLTTWPAGFLNRYLTSAPSIFQLTFI